MTELPESNNYYSYFENFSIDEILYTLTANGWSYRKSGWDEYLLTDSSSEMELYKTSEGVLLNGRLANGTIKYRDIITLFSSKGIRFQAELYDSEKNIILADDFLTDTGT